MEMLLVSTWVHKDNEEMKRSSLQKTSQNQIIIFVTSQVIVYLTNIGVATGYLLSTETHQLQLLFASKLINICVPVQVMLGSWFPGWAPWCSDGWWQPNCLGCWASKWNTCMQWFSIFCAWFTISALISTVNKTSFQQGAEPEERIKHRWTLEHVKWPNNTGQLIFLWYHCAGKEWLFQRLVGDVGSLWYKAENWGLPSESVERPSVRKSQDYPWELFHYPAIVLAKQLNSGHFNHFKLQKPQKHKNGKCEKCTQSIVPKFVVESFFGSLTLCHSRHQMWKNTPVCIIKAFVMLIHTKSATVCITKTMDFKQTLQPEKLSTCSLLCISQSHSLQFNVVGDLYTSHHRITAEDSGSFAPQFKNNIYSHHSRVRFSANLSVCFCLLHHFCSLIWEVDKMSANCPNSILCSHTKRNWTGRGFGWPDGTAYNCCAPVGAQWGYIFLWLKKLVISDTTLRTETRLMNLLEFLQWKWITTTHESCFILIKSLRQIWFCLHLLHAYSTLLQFGKNNPTISS